MNREPVMPGGWQSRLAHRQFCGRIPHDREKQVRDAKGRFVKGTSGNPGGRKRGKKDYCALLDAACTVAKWKAIVAKAIEDAIAGDRWARDWVASYLIGRPTQGFAVSGDIGLTLSNWEERAKKRMQEAMEGDHENSGTS